MNRFVLIFFATLAAFIGSLVALFATINERDLNLRGYQNAAQTAELPFRVDRLGVNAELTQYSSDELDEQLDQMRQANIVWVRQFVRWDEIEPMWAQFNWTQWDQIADAFRDDPRLRLVAVFVNTPQWARVDSGVVTAPPQNPEFFATFVSIFAQRYGDVIDYYQIWDEPNIASGWGGIDPQPVEYLSLLQAGYQAVHDADPRAEVLMAALAPTVETAGSNISDLLYLRDLYALGAQPYFDAVAAKPYGFDSHPEDRTVSPDVLNFSRIIALREIMIEHGDAKKPLWASNWGWNSLPEAWTGNPSIWGQVDAPTRTEYTLTALDRADREWPWLGGMILHHWQPDAPADDPLWGFALVDQDNQPTPLLQALQARSPINTATNGLYPPQNRFTEYNGLWTFSELGADIGWQRDSRFDFRFSGSEVSVLLRKDNYVGYLYPTIDDAPANALPTDSAGNSYIVLTSGSLEPEIVLVPVANGLTAGEHSLKAVADRGFDRWALVGFGVSSGDLAEPYQRQITIAIITAIVTLIASVVSAAQMDWRAITARLTFIVNGLKFLWQLIVAGIASLILMIGMLLTFGDHLPQIFRRDTVSIPLAMLTSGLIYLNPAFVLTAASALILFVLIYHRPIIGLMLIVFYAPFFLFPVELYRFAFPMAELLTLLTFAAWVMWILTNWAKNRKHGTRSEPAPLHPLDLAVGLWVVLGILSLLWTARADVAITELRVMMIEPALFYLMFRTLRPTREDIHRLIGALLVAGLSVAVIGLFLYVRGEAVITAEGEALRMASVYGSPNNVALFLGRCIPILLAFSLMGKVSRMIRVGLVAALIVMLIAVALTQSVGGLFIGVPASAAVVLLMIYRKRALLPLIGLLIVSIVSLILLANVSDRFARAFDFTQGTNFYRLRLWESSLQIISEQPLTGLGLDQFLYEFRGHYIKPDAWQEPNLSHPHNIVLDFWIRLGLGGMILLLAILLMFWRAVEPLKHTDSALKVAVVGAMVNLITHGLIDNSVYVNDLAFVFILLLALAVWFHQNTRSIDASA